jgi:PAS domain S-box-containing protein
MAPFATSSALTQAVNERLGWIVPKWLARLRSETPASRGLGDDVLIGRAPGLLRNLAATFAAPDDLLLFKDARENAKAHGAARAQSSYTVSNVISDYIFLREVLIAELKYEPTKSELLSLSRFFEACIGAAVESFTETRQRRHADEDLRAIADSVLTLIVRVDLDFRYVFVNRAYEEWMGRKLSEIAGRKVGDVVEPGLYPRIQEFMSRARKGEHSTFEYATLRSDGVREHMLFTFVPAHDIHGNIGGVVITAQSIEQQKQSEARLRSIFAHAAVGFAVSDVHGRFLEANPRFCEIAGYSLRELKSRSIADIVHPDDLAVDELRLGELTSGKVASFVIEKRFVKKNGALAWVRNSVSLVPNPGHEPLIVRVAEDVTGVREAERQRRESEEHFGLLADSMPQIVWTANPDGKIDYFNKVWFDYSGADPTLNLTESWDRAAHPDDWPTVFALWESALKAGRAFEAKIRLRSSEGEYRWFMARARPAFDGGGQVKKWYGTNTDIHDYQLMTEELIRAQRAIAEERRKFHALVAEATTPIAVLRGEDLSFEIANRSYLNLFEGREIVGRPLLEALPELEGQAFPRLLREAYDGVPYRETEARAKLRRSAESPLEDRYFDQSYTQIRDQEGKPYGVFIQAIDVTERVRSRRQLEDVAERLRASEIAMRDAKDRAELANAAKSSFLANMSHEIRTPLGAIMGFVSLIKDEGASAQTVASYISVIERNSAQLMRIIDDILDLSKVEAGMMLIEHIDFSLIELLSDFASLMGFRARERGVLFELKASTELPDIVTSDPTRMRQILTNIVGNAIKFTDRGSVVLSVSYDEDGLRFEVSDTGRGISEEQKAKLFQPFAQGDPSTTRKYGGTGLGLVLTRRLSEALGGSFELVSSEPGRGSTFAARIGVRRPEHSRLVRALGLASEPTKEGGAPGPFKGRLQDVRILLVEDSPDNQALFSIYLNRAGAKIDIASDGQRGVEMALADGYDVVLMDVQMPIMDGLTAVRKLRSSGYETPIIALTAHAMKEEKRRCLEAGYSGFLSKPIQRGELVDALVKYRRDG